MNYASTHTYGCRIADYYHKNSVFLILENEFMRIVIWMDKGSDIVEIRHKKSDIDVMWRAPVGIRDITRHIPTRSTVRGNNNDYYPGGWHEAIPGGGPYTEGAYVQGIHGEATLLPWQYKILEDNPKFVSVELSCSLIRTPLHIRKILSLESKSGVLAFEETIQNLSDEKLSFMWGHHPTFGSPLLSPITELIIPSMTFHTAQNGPLMASPYTASRFVENGTYSWPRDIGKDGNYVDLSIFPEESMKTCEMLYLELLEGWYALVNNGVNLAVGMAFDMTIFPYLWYWMNLKGLSGYPWYGSTYNIGLEFWTSWPDYVTAKGKGSLLSLEAKDSVTTTYSFCLFEPNNQQVRSIQKDGPEFINYNTKKMEQSNEIFPMP